MLTVTEEWESRSITEQNQSEVRMNDNVVPFGIGGGVADLPTVSE